MTLEPTELARRTNLLFSAIYPRGEAPRTTEQLVGSINRAARGPAVSLRVADVARAGMGPTSDLVSERIARFFGVPSGYLTGEIAPIKIEPQITMLANIREWDEIRLSYVLGAVAEMITDSMIGLADDPARPAADRPVCLRLVRTWPPVEDELNTRRGDDQKLWRRCESLVLELEKSVGLPVSLAPEQFLDRLAEHRGRPIELRPFAQADVPDGICGLWIDRADRDIIGFPTEARHGLHIVMHEIGHMLAKHRGRAAVGAPQLSRFMPDLDPAMVRAVLGRSVYSEVEEREAELIASLIMDRVAGPARYTAPAAAELSPVDARLQRTFGG